MRTATTLLLTASATIGLSLWAVAQEGSSLPPLGNDVPASAPAAAATDIPARSPFAKRPSAGGQARAWERAQTGEDVPAPSPSQPPSASGGTALPPLGEPGMRLSGGIYTPQARPPTASPFSAPISAPVSAPGPDPTAPLTITGRPDYTPGPAQNRLPYAGAQNPAYSTHAPATGTRAAGTTATGSSTPPMGGAPAPRRGWASRLGLDTIKTVLEGHLKAGGTARDQDTLSDDGWDVTGIVDGFVGGEVSAVTQGGLEYGARLELRGAYDADTTLFGGQVGDCQSVFGGAACPGQAQIGNPGGATGQIVSLRGHTTQLYTGGVGVDDTTRVVPTAGYLFLRSGYGDITLGRDTGSAAHFSLGAPTLLDLGGNAGRADYNTLGLVKTTNDATSFANKITYTSPRLGGDRIGVGVQVGASYTPDVDACGVYYCIRENGSKKAGGSIAAGLEDGVEFGLSLERRFSDAVKVEVTGTYATASAKETLLGSFEAFDDLQNFGAGVELSVGQDFVIGGSWLDSNNALADGDYTTWDAGLTWEPSQLFGGVYGLTIGYAFSEDDNVGTQNDQYLLGVSRTFDRFGLSGGVQYIERTVPILTEGVVGEVQEDGLALFIEGGIDF